MLRPRIRRMNPGRYWLFLFVGGGLAAQCPPGAAMPIDLAVRSAAPAAGGPADVRWKLGREAVAKGALDEARRHLLAALEFHPDAAALLLDMVRAGGDDADLLALWGERWAQAAADAKGKVRIDGELRKALPPALAKALPARLVDLRAQAVAELAKFVEKNARSEKGGNAERSVQVRWAAAMLLEVAGHAPAMLGGVAADVARTMAAFAPEVDVVVAALLRTLRQGTKAADGAATTGASEALRRDRVVRAARILLGLQQQAGFRDLQGPPPPALGEVAGEARAVLQELAAAAPPKVWTIAELEALDAAAREQFTAAHRRWDDPGVALSTTGRYRIETTCGHQTLLCAAQTVEWHHARLVDHFAKDPFLQRQGVVRIVPEHRDLETEGAPYWWAAGFQGGDRTTVRFAWSDVPALGRVLTHELTHRFDGVLRPFLGGWYGEGHAQWTATHYAKIADARCVEDFLDVGTVAHTGARGYGEAGNLERLLKGEVADYRDNYFAGYSLYAFLRSFPPQEPPRYREALARFEAGARGGQQDPLGWFTRCFCDGQQGRADSFAAFVAQWQGFLRGCGDWLAERRPPGCEWVGRYGALGSGDAPSLVLDEPTWSWERDRAEPFFGQDHAAAATLLLAEAGESAAAVAAGLWSLAVDGWRPDTTRALAGAFARGDGDAASAFAALAVTRFPDLPAGGPLPALARLKAVRTLIDALGARSEELAGHGAEVAAAALAAEAARLRQLCGLRPAVGAGPPPPAVPEHLASHGLAEGGLTGFEERRVKGLWFLSPEGDLHVGRERPRDGTGGVDRQAAQRDAFVHAAIWHEPGAYVVRGRVHFTTAYVAGAIVFGHGRRDRGLRLHFAAGDFRYATGRSPTVESGDHLQLNLRGTWQRDGRLPDTAPSRQLPKPREQPWFDFALHVRGPRVLVEIDGEAVLRYAVHDGAPIEGFVGFATSMGAIRVQQPTVQRLPDSGFRAAAGLDVAVQPLVPLDDLLLLPTRGIPHGRTGALVLWLPPANDGSAAEDLGRVLPVLARLLHAETEYPQPWLLAVPRDLPAAERAAIAERLRDHRPAPLPVLEHAVGAPFAGDYPWVLFVDDRGVLRAAAEAADPKLHSKVERWSRLFRGR